MLRSGTAYTKSDEQVEQSEGDSQSDEEADADHKETLSQIEQLLVRTVASLIIANINHTVKDTDPDDDDEDKPTWSESVIKHFNDAWEGLESSDVWNRLNFMIALFGRGNISEKSAEAFLQVDIIDAADTLKDFIISKVMNGGYYDTDSDEDSTDSEAMDQSGDSEEETDETQSGTDDE